MLRTLGHSSLARHGSGHVLGWNAIRCPVMTAVNALQCHGITKSARPLCTAADGASWRVAVVGTGPSGFYTAKYLLKGNDDVMVDLYDRLPVPFGLVRFGVAPDHPEVKSVINDFSAVMEQRERVTFLGGVDVGTDIGVTDLCKHYNAVVFATGSQGDTMLGVPGEELENVFSARAFVNWYNGHPEFVHLSPNLDVEHVVVIGNGNVAIDCARILVKSVEELTATDIADHALKALRESSVKRVTVLGRRGHVQASFTMKELRELTRLDGVDFVVDEDELEAGATPATEEEIKQHRVKKRLNQLLRKSATPNAVASLSSHPEKRELVLRFLKTPVGLNDSGDRPGLVGSVTCRSNTLSGEANRQRAAGVDGSEEVIAAGLVLESIGYKGIPIEGVPFNDDWDIINNAEGQVYDLDGEPVKGLYCAGWAKRGPSGIIGTNIPDAHETVAAVLRDFQQGQLPDVEVDGGVDAVRSTIVESGVADESKLVTWDGYQRIAEEEATRGAACSRPLVKIVDVDELYRIASRKKN